VNISNQGISNQQYKVIPRTLIFLFDAQNRVLLLKGSPKKKRWANVYNGIGGHVEPHEDVMEAALREMAEETGIKNVDLLFCGQLMVDASDEAGVALFVFKGRYHSKELIHSEDGKLKWIALDELSRYPVMEDLYELLPRIAAYKLVDPLIIGKYMFEPGGSLIVSFSQEAFEEN